jgi:glyoxylase-like metal-dependent hydrolase (beta-lactamase superfamily II)
MTTMPIADRWFDHQSVTGNVTLLWEPHVIELMRCNIWHVRGRDRDLVVDTGMGVSSLVDALTDLNDKPVTAVATHGHGDHIGGHHEFDDVVAHPAEAVDLEAPDLQSLTVLEAWGQAAVDGLNDAGYSMDAEPFVTALPAGMTLDSFGQRASKVTRLVDEGDVIDLGDRHFEVLHLPGHSPGSIGLWESATATLFSGDAIYDGPLLDQLDGSNVADYCTTMERLLELPVDTVHGGHDPSFGRDRLREIARDYLTKRK